MGWFILKHIFSTLLAIVNVRRLSDQEKDLEILMLRQQLSILQRKLNHPIKPSKIEKLTLAVLTTKFKQTTRQTANQLRDVIRIFEPETVLRWQSFPRTTVCPLGYRGSGTGSSKMDLSQQKQGWTAIDQQGN